MAHAHQQGALATLFRLAILGITQGLAMLLGVMLYLMGASVHVLMCVMLGFAIAGIVIGDRATMPRARVLPRPRPPTAQARPGISPAAKK